MSSSWAGLTCCWASTADPAMRNVVGLYGANPELTVKAIKLRKYGQKIIARLGGRRVHPNFAVPGGVNAALQLADREAMLAELDEMTGLHPGRRGVMRGWMEANGEDLAEFGVFSDRLPGHGEPGQRRRALRRRRPPGRCQGRQELERFDGRKYLDYIAEHVEPWTYLKFPYYKKLGWPDGVYRVGPLGRLNAAQKMATPLAQQEYETLPGSCAAGRSSRAHCTIITHA